VAGVFFLLGALLQFAPNNVVLKGSQKISEGAKLDEVIQYISENYVDSVAPSELTENAIAALLQNLDPHSDYLSASDFDENTEAMQGNFEGIGVEFNMLEDTLFVLHAIEGGPAHGAGIRAGDRIIKVNGKSIAGISIKNEEVIKLLKGTAGTSVKVTTYSLLKKEQKIINIIRGTIPITSIESSFLTDEKIGYIKIARFASTTLPEFHNHAQKLLVQGMSKLIIDLRDNPGGLLSAAVDLCDEFLSEKKIIVYTKGQHQPEERFYSSTRGKFEKIPLAVLIDEGSASASEIFAGAIQDHDRGRIIGRRSFGKGLVQAQTPLQDGSAIRLTIARYYTPSGRCIQKPYELGNSEDYNNEEWNRFHNGELFNKDSIKTNGDTIYKTASGKIVFGGGGITPDHFIPLDTTQYNGLWNRLLSTEIFDDFCLLYHERNLPLFNSYKNEKQFYKTFIMPQNYFTLLKEYSDRKGKNFSLDELNAADKFLSFEIKIQLARIHFGRAAYFTGRALNDPAFNKAVKLLALTNK
jgi:carboxyl-terminal processing protease